LAVSSELNKHIYVGNGSNKSFPFEFRVLEEDDLHIYLTVISTGITTEITSNYTVTVTDDVFPADEGTITYPASGAAITSDYKLTVSREVDLLQETVYPNNTALKPKVVEKSLDKIAMATQQIEEEYSRTLKQDISVDTTLVSNTLPAPSSLNSFRWNAAGTALELTMDPASVLPAATAAKDAAIAAQTAAETAEDNAKTSETNAANSASTIGGFLDYTGVAKVLNVISKGPWVDIKAFGAKGDGTTDDTESFELAIAYCILNSFPLFISPGRYIISSKLLIEARRITIIGSGYGGLNSGSVCEIVSTISSSTSDIISINESHQELDGATLQGFKIIGSGNEQHGIACYATPHRNNVFRDIRVYGTGSDGWHFEGEGYLEVLENCFGDHCKGWGFNFQGGQSWASGNKKTLGQSSLISCWAEYCNAGTLHIFQGLDVKIFGGQFNGLKSDGTTQNPTTIQITDTWGCDLFGCCAEQGTIGVLVDGISFKVALFGGRCFNQSGTYSVSFNQSGSSVHGGCSITGTAVSAGIYISSDNYGTKIDAVMETNNPAYVTVVDNGYMTEIAPRILAQTYNDKYYAPPFGVTNQKFSNLNNTAEHVLMEQRDGVFEFGYNTVQGTYGYPFKVRNGIVTISSDYSIPPLQLGIYYLWVDTSGRLRIKSGAPTTDTDGSVVGTQS